MRSPAWLGFRGKTLWDWLQLLIVPAILVGVTFAWSATQTRSDNRRADQASQDATLTAYVQQMSNLMLDHNLASAKPGSPATAVARSITLNALRRLDASRKGQVVALLQDAKLIGVVDLASANLAGVELFATSLHNAELREAAERPAMSTRRPIPLSLLGIMPTVKRLDLRQPRLSGPHVSQPPSTRRRRAPRSSRARRERGVQPARPAAPPHLARAPRRNTMGAESWGRRETSDGRLAAAGAGEASGYRASRRTDDAESGVAVLLLLETWPSMTTLRTYLITGSPCNDR
jgi:hypothetical protein